MKNFVIVVLSMLPLPALAHQGDHTGFDWAGLLAHVFETDHMVFAAIAVVTGILCFRAGRRAEAKAMAKRHQGDRP
ncbi:MAG: hypothetical protein FD175_3000 [Beijerinckiaceae bacterium]|nr:MAG: hypothetical protein FD175_3000 [Beijerinckiaceae bacterium]